MTNDDKSAQTALLIEVAELRNDLKHFGHDVKNLSTKLDAYVPRAEIEMRSASFNTRLTKVEDNISKAAWAIAMSWIAGLGVFGSVLSIFKKVT
jgi:hypothetical protein